jgi:hypothetical protein
MSEDIEWIESDGPNIRYDPTSETYRTVHNWKDEDSLSTTVIRTIEAVVGVQSTELPPLYDVVDPDALDQLFRPADTEQQRTPDRLTVHYAGFHATIHADGEIIFHPTKQLIEKD